MNVGSTHMIPQSTYPAAARWASGMTTGEPTRRYLATPAGPLVGERPPAFNRRHGLRSVALPSLGNPPNADAPFIELLGHLLGRTLGLTRTHWVPGLGEPRVVVRGPAPSGGALYPVDAYIAAGPPLSGLWHYDRAHHSLALLGEGDVRSAFTPAAVSPEVTVVLTGRFWRSATKYGAFAYRLLCQEAGALAVQLSSVAAPMGLTCHHYPVFPGAEIDAALALPSPDEFALTLLTLDRQSGERAISTTDHATVGRAVVGEAAADTPTDPLGHKAPCGGTDEEDTAGTGRSVPVLFGVEGGTTPWARRPVGGTAAAGRPSEPDVVGPPARSEACNVDGGAWATVLALHGAGTCGVNPPPPRIVDPVDTGRTVRRSAPSGYRRAAMPLTLMERVLAGGDEDAVRLYVVTLRVVGAEPGVYRWTSAPPGMIRLAPRPNLAVVAPDTRFALDEAAAVVMAVGNPLAGLATYGDGWFRLQQLDVGARLHRVALAATAAGWGSRIHSDLATAATDAALGLVDTPDRTLSALLLGLPALHNPSPWAPAMAQRPHRTSVASVAAGLPHSAAGVFRGPDGSEKPRYQE